MEFDEVGPALDRRWMVVDAETGVMVTQRERRRLALTVPVINWANGLMVDAPGQPQLAVPPLPLVPPPAEERVKVKVWDDEVEVRRCRAAEARSTPDGVPAKSGKVGRRRPHRAVEHGDGTLAEASAQLALKHPWPCERRVHADAVRDRGADGADHQRVASRDEQRTARRRCS